MKRLLLALSFLCIAQNLAQGQVLISLLLGDKLNSEGLEFGLEGGFNWSAIKGLETTTLNRTFNLGFYFDIQLKDAWYLYTGTLVKSSLGAGELTANDLTLVGSGLYPEPGSYDQEIRYFLVPAFIKYRFANRFYVEAGPQFGLRNNAFVQFSSSSDDPETVVKDYNKDQINGFELGLAGGLGYKLKPGASGMSIGVKYHHGLSSVFKDFSSFNRGFFLKINVPIGAGKSKTNEEN